MERKDSWPACGRAATGQANAARAAHLSPLGLLALCRRGAHAQAGAPCPISAACAKLHADGEVVHRLEALVCELQQQAGLPNACQDAPVSERWAATRRRRRTRRFWREGAPVSPIMMYLNRYLRSHRALFVNQCTCRAG